MADTFHHLRNWPPASAPAWAGVWPDSAGHFVLPGRRQFWSIQNYALSILVSGHATLRIQGGAIAELIPGTAFLNEPGVPFCYYDNSRLSGGLIEVWWVRFRGEHAFDLVRGLGLSADHPANPAAQPARFVRTVRRLMALATRDNPDHLWQTAQSMFSLAAATGNRSAASPESSSALAERACRLMQSGVETGMNIDELATQLNVSRSTLFLHFRRRFGKSPIQVYSELRITRATQLLTSTDLPVNDIARLSGYGSAAHFVRRFHAATGRPPGEFRRQSRTHC